MRKTNKLNLWIGGFAGPWMALNAESVQINTETKGEITTIKVDYHRDDGLAENEEIQLKKVADRWELANKHLLDDTNFDLNDPTNARCLIDGLELKLKPNGELYLSGAYVGDLVVEHPGKVVVAKEQSFKVSENFFLNKASLFQNDGLVEVGKNWLCLLTSVKNSGTITAKQGWQVMALQTFENTTSGKFVLLRADILSPATQITNRGQISCILDFNGKPCEFINHAGEVRVGGNATLKSLVNKSETEPVTGGSKEIKRVIQDSSGNVVTDRRASFLLNCGGLHYDCKDWSTPGYPGIRGSCLGCKRIVTQAQNFTRRQGVVSNFYIVGSLVLNQNTQVVCSNIFVGKDLMIKTVVQLKGFAALQKNVTFVLKNVQQNYCGGNFFGGGSRTIYDDAFVQQGAQDSIYDLIPARLEVLGTVTGKVETFINNKADAAQPGLVKTTEAALAQHEEKLQTIATEADIFPALADPAGYEAELMELKTNPAFATMVRLQEIRKAKSEMASEAPSRQESPGLKE